MTAAAVLLGLLLAVFGAFLVAGLREKRRVRKWLATARNERQLREIERAFDA